MAHAGQPPYRRLRPLQQSCEFPKYRRKVQHLVEQYQRLLGGINSWSPSACITVRLSPVVPKLRGQYHQMTPSFQAKRLLLGTSDGKVPKHAPELSPLADEPDRGNQFQFQVDHQPDHESTQHDQRQLAPCYKSQYSATPKSRSF